MNFIKAMLGGVLENCDEIGPFITALGTMAYGALWMHAEFPIWFLAGVLCGYIHECVREYPFG